MFEFENVFSSSKFTAWLIVDDQKILFSKWMNE